MEPLFLAVKSEKGMDSLIQRKMNNKGN